MQRTSEVVGKAIVSADRGERVGTVGDVLLDVKAGRVAGLVVEGGLLGRERVLPYEEVHILGRDAVLARTQDGVVDAAAWHARGGHAIRSSALKNRRVLTRSGREIGAVTDLNIDERSGMIEGYEIGSPSFAGLVKRRATLPYSSDVAVGDDAVIVSDEAGEALQASGHHDTGQKHSA
jgi:uncharacterized protein YrrD